MILAVSYQNKPPPPSQPVLPIFPAPVITFNIIYLNTLLLPQQKEHLEQIAPLPIKHARPLIYPEPSSSF